MKQTLWFALLSFGAAACGWAVSETGAAEDKGVVVKLDDISSKTPAEWKEEEPANKFRYAQFKLPKMKDDKQDAELVIFKGLGGGAKANVKRWKDQFTPPEGKTIDDVSKEEEIKVGGQMATRLDISGTYLFKARPFDPNSKPEPMANYRMVAIYLDGKDNIYQIKLTGPAKTVEAYKKGFDDWVKAFK
jgi:hypothetical protein